MTSPAVGLTSPIRHRVSITAAASASARVSTYCLAISLTACCCSGVPCASSNSRNRFSRERTRRAFSRTVAARWKISLARDGTDGTCERGLGDAGDTGSGHIGERGDLGCSLVNKVLVLEAQSVKSAKITIKILKNHEFS